MHGALVQAGFADSSGWSQAWQAATQRLAVVSETLTINFDKIRSAALLGTGTEYEFSNGHMMVQGELVVELCYDDDEILWYCMGASASRTYSFTTALAKMFHLSIDKGTALYKFTNVMVNSFKISGEAGSENPVTLTMSVVAKIGTVDGAASFPTGLAVPGARVLFRHLATMYLGDLVDALSGSDAVAVNSVEFGAEHNLQIDGKDSSDISYILQPIPNGFRTASLTLGLARYYSSGPATNLGTWKGAGTRLQATMAFQSGSNLYTINFPQMLIASGGDFNVSGPGVLESEVEIDCYYNNDNTFMSSVEDQFEITAV